MDKKLVIALAVLFLLASALASCVELSADASMMDVPQYELRSIDINVRQLCHGDIKLAVTSDVPTSMDSKVLDILQGDTETVTLLVHPGPLEAGMYAVSVSAGQEELGFAVKVTESSADPLMLIFPVVMSVSGTDSVELEMNLRNDGNRQLNNIVVFIEENDVKRYHDELFSLSPGKEETITFDLGLRAQGEYKVEVTAFSGDYIKKRLLNLEVGSVSGPVSTIVTVDSYRDGGYLIKYRVKNEETIGLRNLRVTVEDAPLGWEITAPSSFELMPGETEDIEVIITPDSNPDANVTVALFDGNVLMREDSVELSRIALHGTGLITFGDSLGFGISLFFALIATYFVYLKREEIESDEFAPWEPVIARIKRSLP